MNKPLRANAQNQAHALSEVKLVNRTALAKRYSVSPRQIDTWRADGVLPYVKFGRRCLRFPVDRCDAIFESYVVGGAK